MTVNTEEHIERYILHLFPTLKTLCIMEEPVNVIYTRGKKGLTLSTLVVCPNCKRVWLTVETTPASGWPEPIWRTDLRKCFLHGGGSLFSQHEWRCTQFFDYFIIHDQREVILREILALKEYKTKQREREERR